MKTKDIKVNFVDKSITGNGNPAQADIATQEIFINKQIWSKFSDAEKVFIIEHEKGHILLPTECETLADQYAYLKTHITNKNAFKDAISALKKAGASPFRMQTLYRLVTNEELIDMTPKENNTDKPLFQSRQNFAGKQKFIFKKEKNMKNSKKSNFDGSTTTNYSKSNKVNGFAIGNLYFSMTNILLALILLVLTVQTLKK